MPTIKHITTIPYDIPLKYTLKWGQNHVLAHLQHVLVKVELSDGTIGIAEATPRPTIYGETQASITHIIDHYLAPMLVRKEVVDFESVKSISSHMELIKGNNTAKGALDMAIHHAVSRSKGMTLPDYLNVSRERIRVSYIVSTGTPDAVMRDVSYAYGAGVRVFKVKIGKAIPEEIETIKNLIVEFPSAEFYIDANQCLTSSNGASVLNELVELDVIHCEEPLPIYQIRERHLLRQQTSMPIIADDSVFTFEELQREVAFDTFDLLNIKPSRTGFSVSGKMLRFAVAHHKGIMIGSQASSLLGCLYAAILSSIMEVEYAAECSFFLKTDTDLSLAPAITDGWLNLVDVQDSIGVLIEILT